MKVSIEDKLEQLRAEMIKRYKEVGNLSDPTVIEISQILDAYVNVVQRKKSSQKRLDRSASVDVVFNG